MKSIDKVVCNELCDVVTVDDNGRGDRDVQFSSDDGRPARSCMPVRGGALVEALRCKLEGSRVRFPIESLEFFIYLLPPAAL